MRSEGHCDEETRQDSIISKYLQINGSRGIFSGKLLFEKCVEIWG
jgi:hypothetical protein